MDYRNKNDDAEYNLLTEMLINIKITIKFENRAGET